MPRNAVIAIVLQGLRIGGMECSSIELARRARLAGYDARLVLYETPYGQGDEDFRASDIPLTFIPRRRGIDMSMPIRMATLFCRWKVDIVHARNQVAAIYSAAALPLSGWRPPRLVITFDSFPNSSSAKARLASRWASRRADTVVAVSQEMQGRLVGSGWVTSCQTIWNGVDAVRFSPHEATMHLKEQLGLKPDTLVIGQVARLDPNKRQVDLLEAVAILRRRGIDAVLLFAGDGPDHSALEQRCQTYGFARLLGSISDVPNLMRELDIFVLCSLHEGAPLALLEAMACERAIVATEVGGMPAILDDSGMLVPPSRPDLLANSLERLCKSVQLRRELGKRARQRVLDEFTFECEYLQYELIYRTLLKKPARN